MNKLEQNFIVLLSDPSVKSRDITAFYNWLKNGGLEKCYNKAERIRQIFVESERSDENRTEKSNPDKNLTSGYQQKIINEVDALLRKQSGMTAKDAINALGRELGVQIPSSKRSFRDQVLYLSSKIEGPVIINAAYKIRNADKAHNVGQTDWPLR